MSTYAKRFESLQSHPIVLEPAVCDAPKVSEHDRPRAGLGACMDCTCFAFAGTYLDSICKRCGHDWGRHQD
jgi:hypothetical protein